MNDDFDILTNFKESRGDPVTLFIDRFRPTIAFHEWHDKEAPSSYDYLGKSYGLSLMMGIGFRANKSSYKSAKTAAIRQLFNTLYGDITTNLHKLRHALHSGYEEDVHKIMGDLFKQIDGQTDKIKEYVDESAYMEGYQK